MAQLSMATSTNKKRIVGIGAGGHSRVVIDILRLSGGFELAGLVDADRALWGAVVDGVRVVGDDRELPLLRRQGVSHAFNGIGSTADAGPRMRAFEQVSALGFEFVRAIHPDATVAATSSLGEGVVVMAGAGINPGARIGANVIVNTGAIVEHDCVVGDHSHIATGSRLGGGVRVGDCSHIGIGASIRQGVSVGDNAVVGAGAAVVEDVADGVVVVGVPARVVRKAVV